MISMHLKVTIFFRMLVACVSSRLESWLPDFPKK